MDFTKLSEKLMSMDENTWARHANPWSVYTRFTLLPLISLAFWSRQWIAEWALLPIALALIWVWLNPRLFPAPKDTHNWASMGTFGERIYLERHHLKQSGRALPEHHLRAARHLQILSALGLPIFAYGLYQLNLWALLLGNFWISICKAWFVDRMVWLFMDIKHSDPKYKKWLTN